MSLDTNDNAYYSTPHTPSANRRRRSSQLESVGGSESHSSFLMGTVLGSPFLATSDPSSSDPPDFDLVDGTIFTVPHDATVTRPASPTPSVDFSIISVPGPAADYDDDVFGPGNIYPTSNSSPSFFGTGPRMRPLYNVPTVFSNPFATTTPERSVLRSIFPRIWDALSSPGKRSGSPFYATLTPSSTKKGKGRAYDYNHDSDSDCTVNFIDLPPLDDDEGELIEDEGCFMAVTAVTGIDIIALLPGEISLCIFSTHLDLAAIISCLAVSRTWRHYACDNSVWHSLFMQRACDGWGIDMNRRLLFDEYANVGLRWTRALDEWNRDRKRQRLISIAQSTRSERAISLTFPRGNQEASRQLRTQSAPSPQFGRLSLTSSPLVLDWNRIYRDRLELDQRWGMYGSSASEFEPDATTLFGHTDSVYCLEFDSTRIMTGSRDKTIKVWCLHTGKLLASFHGHRASVLCLKFEKDWDLPQRVAAMDSTRSKTSRKGRGARGLLVSGSSDCTVLVWDMFSTEDGKVEAEPRAVLRGHEGGVLDLRIDEQWIVSCSKDMLVRVWDRRSLQQHAVLEGHEGPVNALGMEDGKLVSGSGDGKMMLWDLKSGQCLRTFEGHERGLACVDLKDDLIISGGNDCKVKIWRASTGELLRTLHGHDALVRALAFDPKSHRLVTASYDKTVKVWDLRSGRMVREIGSMHSGHIFDVKFDASRIISTSHDHLIIVMDFTRGLDSSLFV